MLRKRFFLLPLVLVMAISVDPAFARDLAITVRNVPIQTPAFVEHRHIMLPLRQTFESLNSSVWYDAPTHIITARNNVHVLKLRIDGTIAVLDGHAVGLEAPPRIVNGRVYIPVAFAAQAMGAIITYDARLKILAVNGSPRSIGASSITAHAQQAMPKRNPDARDVSFAATPTDPSTNGPYVYSPYSAPYGSPVGGWNGVTLIGPQIGSGFGAICTPSVVYHVGFQHFYPINTCAGIFGINGLYLTGDPLHPIGQFGPAGIVTPVFFPYHHFRHFHFRPH